MADRTIRSILRAETAAYQRDMQAAAKATEAVGDAGAKAAGKGTSAMATLTASAKANEQAWSTAGMALTSVGAVMATLGGATLAVGISYNTLQQQSRAALKTLTGSAAAAGIQMDKLDDFARNSPFAKQTFIQAQQQMLGFGIEASKVIPYLDSIQNAVAAFGGSNQQISDIAFIMSQISAAGKITAVDLMQLGQRGVDAATLIGTQMGMTGAEIRESITKGTLGADEALDALAAGMTERFDGAADGVKDTMVGAFDRVKAAFRDLASELATPLVDPNGGGLLVGGANQVADFMRSIQDLPGWVKSGSAALFGLMASAALAGGAFLTLTPRIVAAVAATRTLAPAMLAASKSMATWQKVGKGVALLAGVALASSDVADKTGFANTMSLALMGTIAGPWGTAIGGGIGLLKDMATANNQAEDATKAFFKAASDGASLRDLRSGLSDARKQIDDFKDDLPSAGDSSFWFGSPSKALASSKNWFEGLGPGKSDVEELEAQFDEAERQFARMQDLGKMLAAGPGNNWMPSLDEMTDALARALPVAQDLFPELVAGAGDLSKLNFPQMLELDKALEGIAAGSPEAADGLALIGKSADEAKELVAAYKERLKEARETSRDAAGSFLDFGDSIDDSGVSLDSWVGKLEAQLEALRNYSQNLTTAMDKGLSDAALEQFLSQGEAGAQRVAELAKGSKEEIERVNNVVAATNEAVGQFGRDFGKELVPRTEAVTLAMEALSGKKVDVDAGPARNSLEGLLGLSADLTGTLESVDGAKVDPDTAAGRNSLEGLLGVTDRTGKKLDEVDGKRVAPSIDMSSIGSAIGQAALLGRALDNAARSRTVHIGVSGPGVGAGLVAGSNGMTVPAFANGGTPGGTVAGQRNPYGDKVLSFLAPGEEVISNRYGQADRNRALLKAINANSFAGGGTAGGGASGLNFGLTAKAQRDLIMALGGLASSVKGLNRQLRASSKELDAKRQAKDDIKSMQDALESAIRSAYSSDFFAKPQNAWAAGATLNPMATLQADIQNLKALDKARTSLSSKGVKGGLLDKLLQEGSLADVQSLAGWSKADLKGLSAAYAEQQTLLSRVSSSAVDATYGAEFRAARKEFRIANQYHKRIEKRLAQVEKHTKENAEKTGKSVAKNNAKGASKARKSARAGGGNSW